MRSGLVSPSPVARGSDRSWPASLVQWLVVVPNEITFEKPYIAHNIRFTRHGFRLDQVEDRQFPARRRVYSGDGGAESAPAVRGPPLGLARPRRGVQAVPGDPALLRVRGRRHGSLPDRGSLSTGDDLGARARAGESAPAEPHVRQPPLQVHARLRAHADRGQRLHARRTPRPDREGHSAALRGPRAGRQRAPHLLRRAHRRAGRRQHQGGGVRLPERRPERVHALRGIGRASTCEEPLAQVRVRLEASTARSFFLSTYPTPETRILFPPPGERTGRRACALPGAGSGSLRRARGRTALLDRRCLHDLGLLPLQRALPRDASHRVRVGAQLARSRSVQNLNGANYVRNSVKAVVDAYDGSVDLYVFDDRGSASCATWAQAPLPGCFKPRQEMPAGLRAHVRYPVGFLLAQGLVYSQVPHERSRGLLQPGGPLGARHREVLHRTCSPWSPTTSCGSCRAPSAPSSC